MGFFAQNRGFLKNILFVVLFGFALFFSARLYFPAEPLLKNARTTSGEIAGLGDGEIVFGSNSTRGFIVNLKGDNLSYYIIDSDLDYRFLYQQIKIGAIIDITYRNPSANERFVPIYQLETHNAVIYSKQQYISNQKLYGVVFKYFSLILILGSCLLIIRKYSKFKKQQTIKV